ncbi:MAG: extracellular catalytic domain type 2 short-chain-length polyhydroxyalkanoate depolymerase [Microcoleaceae cyanobacterium]|jgi:predicted esterase
MFKKNQLKFLVVLLVTLFSFNSIVLADGVVPKLNGYGADLSQTSVSGLSSGGFMTAQLHVAYSDKFVGAGIMAAGPFDCVGIKQEKNLNRSMNFATAVCMKPLKGTEPDGAKLFKKAVELAAQKKIDDVNNLKDDRVYIFTGSKDQTVDTPVVDQVNAFYEAAGLKPEQIKYRRDLLSAGHAIIAPKGEVPCEVTAPPYINKCEGRESAQAVLTHIYGQLNPAAEQLSGKIIQFDQSEFIPPEAKYTSMSSKAYAYVPAICNTESCKVHIAIHGCQQGAEKIGDKYYTTTGYNEIADTNKMIVLYPQANNSVLQNPQGCWDFWGYSTDDSKAAPVFYTKESPQMKTIMAMVDRLGEKPSK